MVYASSDTNVAICPNAEGNKSQVQAVGVGVAIISATDPVTNISTDGRGERHADRARADRTDVDRPHADPDAARRRPPCAATPTPRAR